MNKYIPGLSCYYFLLLFFASIICCNNVLGQSKEGLDLSISGKKMIARASHAERIGDLYTALFYYKDALQKDSLNPELRYKVAELHRLTRNYKEAVEAYNYLVEKAPSVYPQALYYRGTMKKMLGKYDDAKWDLNTFRKENKNYGDKDFKKLLSNEILGCDTGKYFMENPDKLLVENLGTSVNRPHAEFSPLFIDSTNILFGSLREDTLRYYDVREGQEETQPVRQIYKAVREEGQWIDKGKFDVINDSTMEMGNVVYSSLTGRYYFTKCRKNEHGRVDCKLYFTEKENSFWKKPQLLPAPINIHGYSSTQPTVMIDTLIVKVRKPVANKKPVKNKKGTPAPKEKEESETKMVLQEVLVFVSDRPKGKGGFDLWSSTYSGSKSIWSEPVNLPFANTSETEFTPFFHELSQTLYFSSNGQISAGGLDVFKMKRENRKFEKPENVGFPINSPQDDLGYNLGTDGVTGFLVSNRPGGTPYFHETCCDDIYYIQKDTHSIEPYLYVLNLNITSDDTIGCKGKALNVVSRDSNSDKDITTIIYLTDCNYKLSLNKNLKYTIGFFDENYSSDTISVTTPEKSRNTIVDRNLHIKARQKEIVPVVARQEVKKNEVKEVEKEQVKEEKKVEEEKEVVKEILPEVKKEEKIIPAVEPEKDSVIPIVPPVIEPETHVVRTIDTLSKKTGLKVKEGKTFILEGVEYDTDSFNLTDYAKQSIDSLLIPILLERPDDILIFGSHTDDHGSHDYNVKLSNKRAEQVVKYMISKGIEKIRIHGQGYGETQPIEPNHFPDGRDNPEGRRKNRRTEFMLLKQ